MLSVRAETRGRGVARERTESEVVLSVRERVFMGAGREIMFSGKRAITRSAGCGRPFPPLGRTALFGR